MAARDVLAGKSFITCESIDDIPSLGSRGIHQGRTALLDLLYPRFDESPETASQERLLLILTSFAPFSTQRCSFKQLEPSTDRFLAYR